MEKNINKYQNLLKKRGLKPLTIKNYLWHIDKFLLSLGKQKINTANLKKYQERLLRSRQNVGSLNLHFIIINDYLEFLQVKFKFALLSYQAPAVKVLSQKQLTAFLAADSDQTSLIGRRDKAMLEILYYSGLKVSQLIKLKRHDIDTIKQEIFINGQSIHLDPLTWADLEKYLAWRHDNSPWLFINFDRAQKNPVVNHLSVRSVERIIDKYARRLRPPLIITPQILRHTLAHQIKRQGGLGRDVQSGLHLQNPRATQKYWQKL
ncbi:MAG: site-specific integrase [Patescibacteria group bacterium]